MDAETAHRKSQTERNFRMIPVNAQIEKILTERFGKDSLIALATADQNMPYVRTVDAFYENGSFFVLTHELSNKMKQIRNNPVIAISGDWFTARGKGVSLGWFCKEEKRQKLQSAS